MWIVNGERGERMEDLGEAGIFIIVSDVCYLLAWNMPNVVREMTSFLYVVVRGRAGVQPQRYATPQEATRLLCVLALQSQSILLVRPKSELITRLGICSTTFFGGAPAGRLLSPIGYLTNFWAPFFLAY